jgi:hypothetical protein
MNMIPFISIGQILIVIILIAERILNFILIHLIGLEMKTIQFQLSHRHGWMALVSLLRTFDLPSIEHFS